MCLSETVQNVKCNTKIQMLDQNALEAQKMFAEAAKHVALANFICAFRRRRSTL
jgi:hypothetical protein